MVKYLCNQKKEVDFMAKNENRNYVTLVCSECKHENYNTSKNKKNNPEKMEIKKFCPNCKKTTNHKEKK